MEDFRRYLTDGQLHRFMEMSNDNLTELLNFEKELKQMDNPIEQTTLKDHLRYEFRHSRRLKQEYIRRMEGEKKHE